MRSRSNKMLVSPSEGSPDMPTRLSAGVSGESHFARKPARPVSRRRSFWQRHATLLLMGLPALLLLLVFNYIPMAGLVLAFENYHPFEGIFGSPWVGLNNFQFLFMSQDAWRITFNTVFMNAIFIVVDLVVSLGVALLLNEIRDRSRILSKFYQSVVFFPYFISYVIVGYFVFALLNADNGLVDHLLTNMGLPAIDWYSSPQYWRVILTIVQVWKNAGFWIIVYLAGIIAINPEYYEAARIDGAGKWQQIRWITLPTLSPLIIINILFAIGSIFHGDFGLFFQATGNNPLLYPTTDVIDTYVYRSLIQLGNVGMAAAAGFYQAIVCFILVLFANWIVRRVDAEKALF